MMPHHRLAEQKKSSIGVVASTVKSPNSNNKSNGVSSHKDKKIDEKKAAEDPLETEEEKEEIATTSSPSIPAGIKELKKEDFDEVPEASSPAPAPTKGGEDDFFSVSHVAKIAIKANPIPVTTTSTTTTTASTITTNATTSTKRVPQLKKSPPAAVAASVPSKEASHATTTPSSNGNTNEKPTTTTIRRPRQQPLPKKPPSPQHTPETPRRSSRGKTTTSQESSIAGDEVVLEDDLLSVHSTEPMDVIDRSPYEPKLNAERGIKMFEDMKELLTENQNDELRSISPEATILFGSSNAWCLVKAASLIDKSGMVYSEQWVNGNIQGNMIGKVPRDLLLLCLVSSRFIKASEQLLQGTARDLNVFDTIKAALQRWDLEDSYPNIFNAPNNKSKTPTFHFKAQKRNCLKCSLFVARCYSCYQAFLEKKKIENSLMSKIKSCLDIMESHMDPPPSASSLKKRKKSSDIDIAAADVAAAAAVASPDTTTSSPPAKRKRGRPPKNKNNDSVESVASAAASIASAVSIETDGAPAPKKRGRPPKTNGTNNAATPTNGSGGKKKVKGKATTKAIADLVKKLETQYEEMGAKYREIGETLEALKKKIVDGP